ncbi:MAG TPA: hypothetical protein VEU72_06785 [Nitrosopumilaceae archaeon]|nr:hypothetical protein [Nitrosopumilaceae archaeon]
MKKILVLPVIAVFIAIASVSTQHVLATSTITFDTFPSGTLITNQYENDGVSFTSDAHIFLDLSEATSKPNILVPAIWDQTRSGDLDINIVDPVSHLPTDASSISFQLISIGMNPVTVTAKDSLGNTLYTHTFGPHSPDSGLNNIDPFSLTVPHIRTIIIHGNGQGGDGYGIDDVLVGGLNSQTSIPEFPFSFSLVIIFVAVAAVYMGIRQKMIPGFKSF